MQNSTKFVILELKRNQEQDGLEDGLRNFFTELEIMKNLYKLSVSLFSVAQKMDVDKLDLKMALNFKFFLENWINSSNVERWNAHLLRFLTKSVDNRYN